jgi:acyl carrier protein
MKSKEQERILIDLIAIVRNFNGREYSGTIGPDTFFFRDLEMASIDAVVLAEMLEQFYGQKFPFNTFLANQQLNKANDYDLQLSELVQFLSEHLEFQNDEV